MNQKEKKQKGIEIENYVASLIKEHFPVKKLLDGGDFLINNNTTLEVKSAELVHSQGRKSFSKHGVFVLDVYAHKALKKGSWYAFALTYKKEIILLRFLPKNFVKPFYKIRIHFRHLYHKRSVGLEGFLKKIGEKKA